MRIFLSLFTLLSLQIASAQNSLLPSFGPAFDRHPLTLQEGVRTEAFGPLFGFEEYGQGKTLFRLTPLFSIYKDPAIPQKEFELAYPILSYDKFGEEYRFQFFQVFSFAGGQRMKGGDKDRFTLFPIYFQQRSTNAAENYTALVPIYGHLKNRLFRDEVFFVMLPAYLRTVKRDVVTRNYLFPFFHLRDGPGLKGWQFWPLIGVENKVPTLSTNMWGDVQTVGGHKKFSLLWPIYFNNTLGIGTTNVQKQFVLLPFYTRLTSPTRESTSYGFPLGYTHTIDREKQYEERDMPWPLIVFARGEGKHVNRVWPLFGKAKGGVLQSDFYLWPVYKYNRAVADPLDRERTRILLFLYSDLREKNTATGSEFRRRDLWPLYTWRNERNGDSRFQLFAPLEPMLPHNKSIERVYSPAWSIWRREKNAKTGATSTSLLWNLYRSDLRAESRTRSVFFGLFQRRSENEKNYWRIFFIPFTTENQ